MGQKKLGFGLLVSGLAFGAVACGGGGGSPAAGFTSAAALTNAMQNPTGTVEPATAVGAAQAFQQGTESDTSLGIRQKAQAQSGSGTVACDVSGNATVTYSVNGDIVDMSARYNSCDMGTGCVISGNMAIFGSTVGDFSGCLSYDVDGVCTGDVVGSTSIAFSGCYDGTGAFQYLVDVDGETFTVSGNYADGSGSLTITGANGSFTCTYAGDSGTCTATTGESFTFTPDSAAEAEAEETAEG